MSDEMLESDVPLTMEELFERNRVENLPPMACAYCTQELDVARLQAENHFLRTEVANLRAELARVRGSERVGWLIELERTLRYDIEKGYKDEVKWLAAKLAEYKRLENEAALLVKTGQTVEAQVAAAYRRGIEAAAIAARHGNQYANVDMAVDSIVFRIRALPDEVTK